MAERVARRVAPSLRPVINATGVVLHTNLGRAPLASAAVDAIAAVASGYSCLEIDLPSGQRGHRGDHCRALLAELTGAEDAPGGEQRRRGPRAGAQRHGRRRPVVISRGELIEIGGSFRIPEIIGKSGARLAEVGTTNRTHLDDYREAWPRAPARS